MAEETAPRARVPLVIELVCNCSGRLLIEYNTNLTDTFHTAHEALMKLAHGWVAAHEHCQKANPR